MTNWIQHSLRTYQINISALRRKLERQFGDNYQVEIREDPDFIVLNLPHALSQDELDDIKHRYSSWYLQRPKTIFGRPADIKVPVSHSLQSGHRSTENLPVTEPQDTTASSDPGSIVDEDKDEQALETPDANEIPLFNLASQRIILVNIGTGFKSGGQGFIKLEKPVTSKGDHKIQSGLYSVLRDKGATSSVFEVTGRILRSADRPNQVESEAVVQKFAVKRLDKHTAAAQFWAEYNSLKLIKSLNHPHMVETLSAFRCEENGYQYLNFLFPMALGNLKQLLRGGYDENMGIQKSARKSLWDQFAGLSSAVAYLHDSVQMAHRDIKPSNILIYGDPSSEESLVLKLTDFGLAIDLSKAPTWEAGSLTQQLTWPYDSPEIRRTSPNDKSNTPSDEGIHIPSATELLANDVWKLGCVFTEMVAFLVCGGSVGVTNFRDFITSTEDKVSSDMFNDTRFDDGEKVKDQVLDWIGQMAQKDMRAKWLQPILSEMLARSAERPTIARICDALVQVDFPNINFDDGLRLVRFTPADRMSPLSRIETLRLGIEEWVGRTVDWRPFPRPRPKLASVEAGITDTQDRIGDVFFVIVEARPEMG
ncbi:hypothetical protein CEP54_007471 [Fusarium duplospermum]|uniref:non-specific serine/threonine protein kinase n=1 Tax=Fusarium duplospermum TaxID=1325734 RepID=A0A428Q193_9HYPO|nr:hypothetical protein CEP54_007471 [Fusarium duplospermum]